MKIYTLSYYSDVINTVLGNYSSFARAKDVLLEEVEACHEVLDGINGVERRIDGYGRYPVKDKAAVHAYYEISCEDLDDEEEDEEYDDEYDDYDDDDEDDDEEYDDDEDDDDWDEDDEEEEDYEDGEDDECEAGPWEILNQLIRRGLCGIGIIVGE